MNCLFENYIKFINEVLLNYYRILLDDDYERNLIDPFISKYIDVRYYNNCQVRGEVSLTNKLNDELKKVYKYQIEARPKKADKLKDIFALFSYILYIDGVVKTDDIYTVIDLIFDDENIKLKYSDTARKDLKDLIKNMNKKKTEFFNLFTNEEFFLKTKRIKRKLSKVTLENNCRLSKLYSDYALEKAYNSENVVENRTYLMCLMLSAKLIEDITNLDYTSNYIIDVPETLIKKQKKFNRILNALDDDMVRSRVHLRFTYAQYKDNKEKIDELVNKGYSIALLLDDTFDNNFNIFVLFTYIFVYEKYDYYDIIIDDDSINKSNIVVM